MHSPTTTGNEHIRFEAHMSGVAEVGPVDDDLSG